MNMMKNVLLKMLAFAMLLMANPMLAYADDDDDEDNNMGNNNMNMMYQINDTTAKMDIIVDNRDVYVRIMAPSQLLLGTELKPASLEEQRSYDEKIDELRELKNVVAFTDSAKCVSLRFSEKSPDLLNSIGSVSSKKSNDDVNFENMMDGMGESYITTTLLYKVMCKKPDRLAVLNPTIFDLYDNLDQIYLRWRNNGKAGQKLITAQDKTVYLYNRAGSQQNNMNNMNNEEEDEDDD